MDGRRAGPGRAPPMGRAALLACWAAVLAGSGVCSGPAQADEDGQRVFRLCAACHEIGSAARINIGPPLNGIVGRVMASYPGYEYSDNFALWRVRAEVWTQDQLDRWLQNPLAMIPRTKMLFPGLKKKEQRDAVIAYLARFDSLGRPPP